MQENSENVKNENNFVSAEEAVNASSPAAPVKPSKIWASLVNIWRGLIFRQIFQKIFSLLFALAVFGAVYFYMAGHRSILTYMGVMLLMVIVYAEVLVIRDHLWVIEGSMRESKKWRDVFFNQTNMRRQRIRKLLIMIFSLGIFSYVYMNTIKKNPTNAPILSFMGVMLMITVLYYEILTIRDDVYTMLQSLEAQNPPEAEEIIREKNYDKFLPGQPESEPMPGNDTSKDSAEAKNDQTC